MPCSAYGGGSCVHQQRLMVLIILAATGDSIDAMRGVVAQVVQASGPSCFRIARCRWYRASGASAGPMENAHRDWCATAAGCSRAASRWGGLELNLDRKSTRLNSSH